MYQENTYELIGRATVSWSSVELGWYLIYLTVSHANRDEADAVYFTPNNSTTERKVTRNIAAVSLATHPQLIADLKTLDSRTNDMASDRNAIAHGKFIFSSNKADTSVLMWEVGKNKLIGKDLDDALKDMDFRFQALADDLNLMMYRACSALGKEPPSIEK